MNNDPVRVAAQAVVDNARKRPAMFWPNESSVPTDVVESLEVALDKSEPPPEASDEIYSDPADLRESFALKAMRGPRGPDPPTDWKARYDALLAVAQWLDREIENYHDHDDMAEEGRCKLCAAQAQFAALEKESQNG